MIHFSFYFLFFFFFSLFFFFEKGLTTGQKLKRDQLQAMNKQIKNKKLMSSLEQLSLGDVGLQLTRGRLRAKKKKYEPNWTVIGRHCGPRTD
jgi:hypothetical protein